MVAFETVALVEPGPCAIVPVVERKFILPSGVLRADEDPLGFLLAARSMCTTYRTFAGSPWSEEARQMLADITDLVRRPGGFLERLSPLAVVLDVGCGDTDAQLVIDDAVCLGLALSLRDMSENIPAELLCALYEVAVHSAPLAEPGSVRFVAYTAFWAGLNVEVPAFLLHG